MWALGITLFYMITGRTPYDHANKYNIRDLVLNEDINFDLVTYEPVRNLLKKILEKDQDKRASLDQILMDPWVTNDGKEILRLDLVDNNFNKGFGNLKRGKP